MGTGANKIIVEVVKDALATFGKPAMESLVWQLDQRGVSLSPSTFDINKFEQEIKLLMGGGATILLAMIYQKLCQRVSFADAGERPADDHLANRIKEIAGMTD